VHVGRLVQGFHVHEIPALLVLVWRFHSFPGPSAHSKFLLLFLSRTGAAAEGTWLFILAAGDMP